MLSVSNRSPQQLLGTGFSTEFTSQKQSTGVLCEVLGLSTRERGSDEGDKLPVFTLLDRGAGSRYVVPAKSADESTVRLLLAEREKESLSVYIDGFRAYDLLDDDDRFHRESATHASNEYVDGDVHINTCESHGSLVRSWLSLIEAF